MTALDEINRGASFAGQGDSASSVIPYEQRLSQSISYVLDEGGRLFVGTSEVNKTLRRITKRLDELGIPYAVAGGMAMIAHGYIRFTDDVDILVTREDLHRLHDEVDGRGWVRPFSGSKNLRDADTGVKIEFLLAGEFPGDGKPKPVAFPAPADVAVEIQGAKYLNVPTLINLKLASYMTGRDRAKDLGDVQELMKALDLGDELTETIDPYVRHLYADLCDKLSQLDRPHAVLWIGERSSHGPVSSEELKQELIRIDPKLAAMFTDGVSPVLVQTPRGERVKLVSTNRRTARKYNLVDESEILFD
jgi:hypothetical protein